MEEFWNIFKDIKDIIAVLEIDYIKISLIADWESIYKGRAKVYLLGIKEKRVVDNKFNKVYLLGYISWANKSLSFSHPCFVV